MLLIIKRFDGETSTIHMEYTEAAFTGCCCTGDYDDCDCGPGFQVAEGDDFTINDGEYVGLIVMQSMYEMGCASGSFPTWGWAVIPEGEEEASHLRKQCSESPAFCRL